MMAKEDEFPFGSKPIFRGYVEFQGCIGLTILYH